MKKQKENSHEGITWSEMGKQNVQAEKVYWSALANDIPYRSLRVKLKSLITFNEFSLKITSASAFSFRKDDFVYAWLHVHNPYL